MLYKMLSQLLMLIRLAVVLFVLRFPSCLLWCHFYFRLLSLCLRNASFLSYSVFYTSYLTEMLHFFFQFIQLENDFIAFMITSTCRWCMMYSLILHALRFLMLIYDSASLAVWDTIPQCSLQLFHFLPFFCLVAKLLLLNTYLTQCNTFKVEMSCSRNSKTVASVAKVRRIISTFLLPNQGCCHNSTSLHTEEHMEDTEQHMEWGCQNHRSRMMSL